MRILLTFLAGLVACTPTYEPVNKIPNALHTPLSKNSWIFYSVPPTGILDGKKVISVEILYRENYRSRPNSPVLPITSQRLAAFQAARTSGRGLEPVLVAMATDVARRTDCPHGDIRLARPTTHYHVPARELSGPPTANAVISTSQGTPISVPSVKVHSAGGTVRLTCESAATAVAEISAPQLKSMVSDRTHRSYSKQHGTQVEYLSPNGTAYLWYPGNTRAVIGRWDVEANTQNPNAGVICFAYKNSYNPVTRTTGGRQCVTAHGYKATHRESRSGDIFNLSSGRIPYRLPKQNLALDAL